MMAKMGGLKMRHLTKAIAAMTLAITATGLAQPPSVLQPVIDLHDAQENTGLAAVIMRDGTIISEAYLGDAVVEHRIAVDPDTRFQAMSITKAFVGAALIKSHSLGLVELDVPIRTYMHELARSPVGEATLDQLASHMAGLTHLGHPSRKALYVERFDTARDSLETFIDEPLTGSVGEEYSYSSAGYNLIAAILETVHDKPFAQVLEELVTRPMGLQFTAPGDVMEPLAGLARNYSHVDIWSYQPSESLQLVPTWDFSFNPGGGNIVTTARDLARFGHAFAEPGYFTEAELAQFGGPIAPGKSRWTYGWFVTLESDGSVILSISGATPGVQAGLVVLPDNDIVVSALANCWCKDSAGGDLVVSAPRNAALALRQVVRDDAP